MDNYEVMQGTALPLTVTITDAQNSAALLFDGSEPLAAEVWPGGQRPAAFAVDVDWSDPEVGQVDVTVGDDQTDALEPGRYQGAVYVTTPNLGRVLGYRWSFDLLARAAAIEEPDPDAPAPPPIYCDFDDMLDLARGWLRNLQSDLDDEAGFLEQRQKASRWLDDLILARAPSPSPASLNIGSPGFAALAFGGNRRPSPWLRSVLEGGGLEVREWVRECVARRAIHLICDGQIGPGEDKYEVLARRFKTQSHALATANTAEIRTTPGGAPTLFVQLGTGSLR